MVHGAEVVSTSDGVGMGMVGSVASVVVKDPGVVLGMGRVVLLQRLELGYGTLLAPVPVPVVREIPVDRVKVLVLIVFVRVRVLE